MYSLGCNLIVLTESEILHVLWYCVNRASSYNMYMHCASSYNMYMHRASSYNMYMHRELSYNMYINQQDAQNSCD
jgi:hypothetical protein